MSDDTIMELERAAEILSWELPTASPARKKELEATIKVLLDKARSFGG